MPDYKIGFIGTGQMASALATGFTQSAGVVPANISAFDIEPSSLVAFCEKVGGCNAASNNAEVVRDCELIFLCVKPQIIPAIIQDLRPQDPSVTYISVMGGITLGWLEENLQTNQVIRTMPNTPCLIGEGAVGIAPSQSVDEDVVDDVVQLFESVGLAFVLPERQIDVVTGLSGSGPAFVFQFIEALADGAVQQGLPRPIAQQLAAQTVVGAGKMVVQLNEHPAVLKDRVASPAGTTIQGIKALEEAGFRGAAMNAVAAATQRSVELGSD